MIPETKIAEFKEILHHCLKDGTCHIVDRGLAWCDEIDNYCNMLECPKIKSE